MHYVKKLTIIVNSKPIEAAQHTITHDLKKLRRIIKVVKDTRKTTMEIIMKIANEVKST